ncbi:MAG: hypothetical protein HQL38_20755, partial [Alphaproteobacteria bacterium]|nr:hypothetical protein [Alphaproteobacteria bacterium]
DAIVTDLCPMDVLIQRLGRCWRKVAARTPGIDRPAGQTRPQCVVIRPDIEKLVAGGQQRVVKVANIGDPAEAAYDALAAAATLVLLEEGASGAGISVPADCRRLVEMAVTPSRARELVAKRFSTATATRFFEWSTANEMIRAELAKVVDWSFFPDEARAYGDFTSAVPSLGTRLGATDVTVSLHGAISPFDGGPIGEVSIPGYLWENNKCGDRPKTTISVEQSSSRDGFTFNAGNKKWIYDAQGLYIQRRKQEMDL